MQVATSLTSDPDTYYFENIDDSTHVGWNLPGRQLQESAWFIKIKAGTP